MKANDLYGFKTEIKGAELNLRQCEKNFRKWIGLLGRLKCVLIFCLCTRQSGTVSNKTLSNISRSSFPTAFDILSINFSTLLLVVKHNLFFIQYDHKIGN
jgi:hypothetical protein